MAPGGEDVVSAACREGKFVEAAVPPRFCALCSDVRKTDRNGLMTAVYRQAFPQFLWKNGGAIGVFAFGG
jgi:hypothetical protein